jgi:3-phosphoshikimate 1-carboxyvinyltransferase
VLEILTEMGADIQLLNRRDEAGEPVADLRVRAASLHGIRIGAERIPQTIDEFPILCVAAALAEGETTITGAGELRVKESDRIATMTTELRKMGASIEETNDGLIIQGLGAMKTKRLRGAACTSYGDHRVAMSMAIAGLTAEGETKIQDSDCIETSFPGFEAKLVELLTKNR